MDPAVGVAVVGLFGTITTGGATVIVSQLNSKKERANAAESAVEKTLRERLLLRDEQIAELKEDLERADKRADRLQAQVERFAQGVQEQRAEEAARLESRP